MTACNPKIMMSRRGLLALGGALAAADVKAQQPGSYPERSLRLVVPFPPGGTIDTVSRLVAQHMGERAGVSVVVDNRAGAGGTLGADQIAKSAPDGYNLLVSNVASHGIAPGLYARLPYDAVADFTHIGMFGAVGNVLLVPAASPIRSLADLIKESKARPDRLTFGSAGNGSSPHLSAEMLKSKAGISLTHVPYRGAGPARTALLAREIDLLFENIPTAVPYVTKGDLRPILVTTESRHESLPDVPTAGELGLAGCIAESWYGLSAPKDLPPAILSRLSALLVGTLREPSFTSRMEELGLVIKNITPPDYTAYITEEVRKWTAVVKEAGATVG